MRSPRGASVRTKQALTSRSNYPTAGCSLSDVSSTQEVKQALRTTLGGDPFDGAKLDAVLAEAFGASAEFLARTTTVPSSAVDDEAVSAFALHEHLCRVLGVDDLIRVANQMEQLHDQNETEAKGYRDRIAACDGRHRWPDGPARPS